MSKKVGPRLTNRTVFFFLNKQFCFVENSCRCWAGTGLVGGVLFDLWIWYLCHCENLHFGLILHPHPNFVYGSRKGGGELAHLRKLATALTAQISCSKIGFQDRLSLNAGQTYCRMLEGKHSPKLSPFIKLPFVIKIFFLSFIFEWPLKTGFAVIETPILQRQVVRTCVFAYT